MKCVLATAGPGFLHNELATKTLTYGYIWGSTTVVFTLWGYWTGRRVDEWIHASLVDPLTGLWNRRYLHQRTIEELKRALRHDTALSFLLVDVDHLKQINDRGGHTQGDLALKLTAEALKQAARGTDVVARWGGDEFAILVPRSDSLQVIPLADRVHATLRSLTPGSALKSDLTVSIGIADMSANDADEEALWGAADAALYEAKRQGRNRTSSRTSALAQSLRVKAAPAQER